MTLGGGQTVCHTLTACYFKAGFVNFCVREGNYGQIAVVELTEIEDVQNNERKITDESEHEARMD